MFSTVIFPKISQLRAHLPQSLKAKEDTDSVCGLSFLVSNKLEKNNSESIDYNKENEFFPITTTSTFFGTSKQVTVGSNAGISLGNEINKVGISCVILNDA